MTTENVAVLFTDVVSSTELSQKVSPEESDEVRRGHFSILRQALAEAGGTEVKNLGDGLMAVFDSASAGLACGVAMQQGVELDDRDRPVRDRPSGWTEPRRGHKRRRRLLWGSRRRGGPALRHLRRRTGLGCPGGAIDGRSPEPSSVSRSRRTPSEGPVGSGRDRRGALGTCRSGGFEDLHPSPRPSRGTTHRRRRRTSGRGSGNRRRKQARR